MSVRNISILALSLALSALSDAAITDSKRAQPLHTVTIYKSTYATLDDAWESAPNDDFKSNKFFAKLPVGWSVAEDTSDARIAIQMYNFGTEYLVLRTTALNHNLQVTTGQAVVNDNYGIKSSVSESSRILIRKDESAPVEKKPYAIVPITNLITFKGRDYAMADDAQSMDKIGGDCDRDFHVLPDGWEVAADNEDTHAVMISARFPFKHICKVTSSGQGYAYGLQEPGCTSDMLVKATMDDKEVFGVKGRMCGALILSRKSELPKTWTEEVDITNVYKVTKDDREHHYAVLDNTPAEEFYLSNTAEGKCTNCCQDVAMKIPMGWELAKIDMPGYVEASRQPWGTYCTGGMTFDGMPCEYSVASNTNYAAARYCDHRVLIKRTPIDCVSGWSEWSECSSDCASVKTRMRTEITQPSQFGGMCEMVEKTSSGCRNTCPISSSSVSSVSSDSVVSTSTSTSTSTPNPAKGGAGATVPSVLASFVVVAYALLF